MIDVETYRSLALSLPESVEGSHFEAIDFRVRGKIFATWREDRRQAVVKLTPEDQRLLIETMPGIVSPISGGWGAKGWSRIDLDAISHDEARHVLAVAWRTVAPKRLAAALPDA